MKALARCYVWWPNMDDAITAWVSASQACQELRPAPLAAKGHTWETPKTPWSRVHIDLAGPFHGRTFMVVVDAYSKWLEVALMPSTTTEAAIRVLQGLSLSPTTDRRSRQALLSGIFWDWASAMP
ncbi:uncharacterized protein K02A2.6-like [Podarcis raffonei]|uniref:uncharacterized protein K02A2.6-like n=1 Tax=Podarcis raffonei TaxID=65483 RepID=UPI0023298BB0|nr:uncharacterized protein K02A2.6-like [Podarcis raffonei]